MSIKTLALIIIALVIGVGIGSLTASKTVSTTTVTETTTATKTITEHKYSTVLSTVTEKVTLTPKTYTVTETYTSPLTTYATVVKSKTLTSTSTVTSTVKIEKVKTATITSTITVTKTLKPLNVYVEFLTNIGEEYLNVARKYVENASFEILVIMYGMKYDPREPEDPANLLIEALGKASLRGVKVKVILDQYSTSNYPQTVEKLKEYDVAVVEDPKGVRMHAKVVVIDRKIMIIGSNNWTESGLHYNYEAAVLILNSEDAIEEFINYFNMIWEHSTPL